MSDDNNIQSAIDAGREMCDITKRIDAVVHPEREGLAVPVGLVDDEHGSHVAVLDDVLDALDRRLPGPRRRVLTTRLTEVASYIECVNRWSDIGRSVIYADTSSMTLTAVFDEHPPSGDPKLTGWREHRALYTAPRSSEWRIWSDNDGKVMSQTKFGDFLESRLEDMRAAQGYPLPTEVLSMARALHLKIKGEFKREIDPTTGNFHFIHRHENDTGSTVIPRAFLIAIPVFDGGDLYEIEARVRFALEENRPAFSYTLHRKAEIERDAFRIVRDAVGKATTLPILAGLP